MIQVRFFASLREEMGKAEVPLEVISGETIAEVWARVADGKEAAPNLLAARNMEYSDWETVVEDGDEIAFFPPVTGGSV